MANYVKLFSSVLDSTVWESPLPTKVVWITMLAMADRDGEVGASVPGLAKRAGVDRLECERALAMFLAPDPDSRTKEHDGRRIAVIDGGWRLLNYEAYRDKASADEIRQKDAARQKRKYDRDKAAREAEVSRNLTDPHGPSPALTRPNETSPLISADLTSGGAENTAAVAAAQSAPQQQQPATQPIQPPDSHDVAACWHRYALQTLPGAGWGHDQWRSDYRAIAEAVANLARPHEALDAVVRWWWTDRAGPIASGRIKANFADPAKLAKRITRDLASALGTPVASAGLGASAFKSPARAEYDAAMAALDAAKAAHPNPDADWNDPAFAEVMARASKARDALHAEERPR